MKKQADISSYTTSGDTTVSSMRTTLKVTLYGGRVIFGSI